MNSNCSLLSLVAKALFISIAILPAIGSAYCYEDAGEKYQIDPLLLKAMAVTESSENSGVVSKPNKNGSRDYYLMQINELWFETLERYDVSKEDLKDPCQSVHVGAWILAGLIKKYGNNWRAVGAYNAGTRKDREKIRQEYANRVKRNYLKLVGVSK